MSVDLYIHEFIPGREGRAPLLLLHRTGGTETDLVAAARQASPCSPLLCLRGNVLEEGKPRFFRRLAKGQFDLEDLAQRTAELVAFLSAACAAYAVPAPVAFGFSNGANMAFSLLLAQPDALRAAILMRPAWTYQPTLRSSIRDFPVLIIGGAQDQTVTPTHTKSVAGFLASAGADVTLKWVDAAHDPAPEDAAIAGEWLSQTLA